MRAFRSPVVMVLVLIGLVVAVFLLLPLATPVPMHDPFPPEGVSPER